MNLLVLAYLVWWWCVVVEFMVGDSVWRGWASSVRGSDSDVRDCFLFLKKLASSLKPCYMNWKFGFFYTRARSCEHRLFSCQCLSFRVSVCPSVSAWISAAPAGMISFKFVTGNVYRNLSGSSEFGKNWVKMSVTLREDLSMCYCSWRY
jgi:hypothetical protein